MLKYLNIEILPRFARTRARAGEVLLESLVAITIVVVGLLGLFSMLTRSVSLTRVIADRHVASNLAAEGIEVVKNIIDGNVLKHKPWNSGVDDGTYEVIYASQSLAPYLGRNFLYDAATGLYGYGAGTPTNFVRRIEIQRVGSEEIKVNSIVSWLTRGGASFDINVEDHFLNH